MKIKLTIAILLLQVYSSYAQTNIDSLKNANIKTYYKAAMQCKDGNGVPIDYACAYENFTKASKLGDAQSTYAIAYMHYKGLGCTQNYDTAAILFAKGAKMNRENSLYFYGLCWRNGYGLNKNEDSAKFYLKKAADLGYKLAAVELAMLSSENSNDSAAQVLLQQINNAAIPDKQVLNTYNKIKSHLPSIDLLAGEYNGWLIQYDWSGKHMVATKSLKLSLSSDKNNINGQWIEEGADTAKIIASMAADSLVFNNTKYGRKDHYSPDKLIQYSFQNAKLRLIQLGDSVFLAGTVEMFSAQRGEPSKPLYIALSRKGSNPLDSVLNNLKLTAYPNPSSNILYAQFALPKTSQVEVHLYNLNGLMIYHNTSAVLGTGSYSLPIPVQNISSGTYILKIICGNQYRSVKVLKQ